MLKMTKGYIDRLGDKIREEKDVISDSTLNELQQYRISHKSSLSKVFNVLCYTSKEIHSSAIVTYRIKRFESIIGKLSRYPQMKFSRMWDIGGCRCILRNDNEVYRLKKLIEKHLEIRKIYDYIQEPQEEGYRSLHLFVNVPNDDKVIEIQLRNQTDHNWATLVEITDLLFDSKLKEYHENQDLLRFHYLLSQTENLGLSEKNEIAFVIKKYEYFERLSTVFSRNYLQVRKQWFDIESQSNHKFFLIETKKDEIPKIESFAAFSDAETKYFTLYKSSQNANVVLTHLPNPCYNQISMAYSNYILTFHSFLNECYSILESLIVDSLKNRKYTAFFKIYNLYSSIVFIHIRNLMSEIKALNAYNNTTSKPINRKKKKEWENDIRNQANQSQERSGKLLLALRKNMPPTDFGKFIVKQIIVIIGRKYHRKIKKVMATKKVRT